ncbi:MAG: GtrA family protein, partial [bacterium]|nr:GtrA family protein [bacterium]
MELIKQIFQKLKSNGFLHYAIVGSSSYIINLGSLIIIVQGFKVDPVVGSSINQIFVLFYVFLLNKFWSFKSKGKSLYQM